MAQVFTTESLQRLPLKHCRRLVVKIGSALLTNDGQGLDLAAISDWAGQMAAIRKEGIELVLVSSGSVAAGMRRLGWRQRPETLHELQAAAATGQTHLVRAYEQCFERDGICTAQVLLDHDDLSNRQRYLNARSTLLTLTDLGVIPVVNENDTVVTDEIRFGDNDTLAALVANLVEAEILVILTDQDGMYSADPRSNPNAEMINLAAVDDPSLAAKAGGGGRLGRGGMVTKVRAAQVAARSGAHTVIVGGRLPNVLTRLYEGEALGTFLVARQPPEAARKRWIAGQLQMRGHLVLDAGAVKVLREGGKSLLPVGVSAAKGNFKRGDMVACVDSTGREIARGLVNYDCRDVLRILGHPSHRIEEILGYMSDVELIHRDNLVLSSAPRSNS